MRTIVAIHKAEYSPIGDLITWRALPTCSVEYIDPFLFLNHHGPQVYAPLNNGLPFGPHPHRGMETVTFILEGDISHKDSGGGESVINKGGVQWMTAGSGLIHAEVSSEQFKQHGGKMEILQLWLNLPAARKMTTPKYKGFQEPDIPVVWEDEGRVRVNCIAGDWKGRAAAFDAATGVHLNTIVFQPGSSLNIQLPAEHSIFFYVIRGELLVGDTSVPALHLAKFKNDGNELRIQSPTQESILLWGHAAPLNEPVVAHGPFVMNSEEEIAQAYQDYRAGKFGSWQY